MRAQIKANQVSIALEFLCIIYIYIKVYINTDKIYINTDKI